MKFRKFNFSVLIFPTTTQEVEKILPELVFTDVDGYKSVDYSKLTPVLVEAIKELKAANDLLKTDIEKIKAHLGLEAKAEK